MRSWPPRRSLSGAWLRLFVIAVIPLFLMVALGAVLQARLIPGRVREASSNWVEAEQRLLDHLLTVQLDLAGKMAEVSESQSNKVAVEAMLHEVEQSPLLLAMGWFPDSGEPVLTEFLQPIAANVYVQITARSETFQLLPLPSTGKSLLLITAQRPTGRQVSLLLLDAVARALIGPGETDRWLALADSTGQELPLHDLTLQLAGRTDVVSVRSPIRALPGWSLVGYASTRSAMAEATTQLGWTIGFLLLAISVGLVLATPGARELLRPMRRLREVAQALPNTEGAEVQPMSLDESAVALVDRLEDRLLYLEEQHQHFFAGSDVPFCIVTWEGKLLEVNQAWCRLIGYPADYFKTHKISDTLHPLERFHVTEGWPEMQSRSMTVNWTWRHLSATGEELWINWSLTSDLDRQHFYGVCRNVTSERAQERQRLLQSTLQDLWLIVRSGTGIQDQLEAILTAVEGLFPEAALAIWEETDNGRWLLRVGAPRVHPEQSALTFEITGELVRFGLLVVESEPVLSPEEESFLKNLAELISTAVKQEQESIRLTIQHSVNRLLAEADGVADLLDRLLPLICHPLGGVAARYWAPGSYLQVEAEWIDPQSGFEPEIFATHQWTVHQTLADGHPRWIAAGTRLPHRPAEILPVGRITFAVRVGAQVVGCIDCLVPVLRTPEAGFLTLLESLGAQIGLYRERRTAEEERSQQAILAAGRADVMELVTSGASLESVLERICLLAERRLPNVWTLAVFYDAQPDRSLVLTAPSCPPERFTQFHEILRTPRAHEVVRQNNRLAFAASQAEIVAAMPVFGPVLVAMNVQTCWVWPVPIPPRNGTLRFSFYSAVEGGLTERHESVLSELSHIAQMAVERWWLEKTADRRVDLLLAHMQEGLVAVDEELRLVETNPAASKILRLPSGRPSPDLLPEPLAEAFRRAVQPDGQPFPATMTIEGDPVYAYISQVRSEEGALLGAIAILEDSTLRQRFQQLQTSLVANVSHDLKAPLAALGALVETVADPALSPEEQQQYLGSMRAEIGRLRRLTSDLLLLARLDAGLLTLEPEALAMEDLLRGVAEVWAPRCQANELSLSVVGEPTWVWADYDRLVQILTNLLDNATKFTPPGGSIQLGVERAAAGRVRLFVRDSGPGIAPEHLERLGSRFYMVDPARQRTPATGTGLGLSIVRSLAEQMGGQVQFESDLGTGMTVWIELPAPVEPV